MSKINFSTHGKDIQAAYDAVINEKDSTDWLIYAFDKGTYDLRVQETGDDGLEGLTDEFSDGKIQFAFARVKDPNTELPKFVFIAWCGSGVPELRKAFFNSQLDEVSRFFKSFHVQINARDEADVEPELIIKRVSESSGANYSVHKEAPKPQPKVTPVGSVYKKTEVPDIASMQRQSMTKENMPVPVGTNYKPVVTTPKKLESRWNMAQQDNGGADAVRAEREKFEREVRERETQKQSLDNEQLQAARREQEEAERRIQEEEAAREHELARQQQLEEENRRRQEAERQLREQENQRIAEEQQQAHQMELERQQREEEERIRKDEQRQAEENQRRRQEEEETQRRYQEEEVQRRRQEEEAQHRRQEEEAQRRHQEEEVQRRRQEEEAQYRYQEEEAERQHQEQAVLKAQLNETADRAVHTSQAASATAVLPAGNKGVSAVVLFAYDASEANEMSLEEGEVINEIDQVDEGWWFGVNENGKEGLFPANYVEILEEQEQEPVQQPEEVHVPRSVPPPPPVQQEEDTGKVAVALYDYEAGEDNEISFNEGEVVTQIEFVSDDWWQGLAPNKKNVGLFPANYVELKH